MMAAWLVRVYRRGSNVLTYRWKCFRETAVDIGNRCLYCKSPNAILTNDGAQ